MIGKPTARAKCLERPAHWTRRARRTGAKEVGRGFDLGMKPRLLACLEEAIRMGPLYLPGWQYLLRLLALNKSSTGSEWARKAEELFPSCYTVALLGSQTYPLSERVGQLLRLLDRYGPGLTTEERPSAALAFGEAIRELIKALPMGQEMLSLLRRAVAIFPESGRLTSDLGFALYQVGQVEEALQCHAKSMKLHRATELFHEEFPRGEAAVYHWQFAEHILKARGVP